jgi:predicted small metal-binding protein
MDQKLYKISCDPNCGFQVQGHDEKEVINMAIQHAKDQHQENLSEDDARANMVSV